MSSETAQLSPPYPDDFTLAAAVKNRERNAGDEFVQRFGSPALATARRFLHSDSDCEDAVQDSFLSAIQSIGTFKGNSTLGTWLHRIVVNVCLMKLRSCSRQSALPIEALLPAFDASGRHKQAVRRWKSAPDETLLREETRELVRCCIGMLPEDHRTVLILRDIQGLNTQETAEILRATPATVKTRLHRARQALRTLLEPYFV